MAKPDRKKSNLLMTAEECGRYWRYIEKIAFSPGGTGKDKKGVKIWLEKFIIHFQGLYEKPYKWPNPEGKEDGKRFYKIDFGIIDGGGYKSIAECQFMPNIDPSKFGISIGLGSIVIQFDYDSQFACECDGGEGDNKFDEKILVDILDKKIDHPALHYHLERPDCRDKYPHDIRIANGIKNPYVFLYQLAYQFLCLLGGKQQDELKRLKKVIFENRDRDRISPGTLFGSG